MTALQKEFSAEDSAGSDTECEDEPSTICESDRCPGSQSPVWHCVDCDSSYCSDCWPRQGPHKPKKKGRDGVPHEKTNPHIVKNLKAILNPTRAEGDINRLHEADESTKWFGVSKDPQGRPNFEDYGRYATLMSSISPDDNMMTQRYPQLVSFIGVTNAGKSTLIKMLINHGNDSSSLEQRSLFPSPVVGSVVHDNVPTSGDVHLYADPSTHAEQLPLLYADCEGFEGGERLPIGARARHRTNGDVGSRNGEMDWDVHTRPIQWAQNEETRQREYAVTALYPRLLYTFSDCVVFVLRNPKTFQSAVLTKLLDWGAASLEKSINQPALPHCIVALNGTDPSVDDREWDTSYATQRLLSSVSTVLDELDGVPRYRELADYWRGLGKHIYTIEDLILRYYSSFKVIRIPAKPKYMVINEQIGELHNMIKANCEHSFRSKRTARMLTNADELNIYLQSGFDHFTRYLNIPFNFMQISLLRNPIPNDFGGHILQLCTTISKKQPSHPGRVSWMFEKMSMMLASCVLLDCARFRKGQVDQLFTNYETFFDYAMLEFLELHYPCAYVGPDGRKCMLVKARHQPKGHQDEKGIIAAGDYQAVFDSSFVHRWKGQLTTAINRIQRDFQYELEQLPQNAEQPAIPEERIALDLHAEYINSFFEQIGPASQIRSHATCFCCLMDVPEHPLPCGHVFCNACVKAYGKTGKASVAVPCCPLHPAETQWTRPALIKYKPIGAGLRVLSLDGGGIRGIVQLEVLYGLEQVLGGHVPIQCFFDLIVGTGTGGLAAIALSMKDRQVGQTLEMFSAMMEHAFTPRLKGLSFIGTMIAAIGSGPRYKTAPFHDALKTAFSDEENLFGIGGRLREGTRVALTSTSVTGRESMVLASYRRPDDPTPVYKFERPHEPEMELKVWQAVAASCSTPSYFKPLMFHNQIYLDGGLRSTNPCAIAEHEMRLLWPTAGEPDLFLSLGTGQNRINILSKLSERPKEGSDDTPMPRPGQTLLEARKGSRWRSKRFDDVLDAEIAWTDFRNVTLKNKLDEGGRRYIRFNPDLDKEPPAQDAKSDIQTLQVNVRKRLMTPHRVAALRNVAHRLVASSFFFDLKSKATGERSEQLCSGVIACRFEDTSDEMRSLGKVLQDRHLDTFEPYFLVKPDAENGEFSFRVTITIDVIRGMIDSGVFGLPNIHIPLRDDSRPTSITLFLSAHDGLEPDGYPISAFPRVVLGDSSGKPNVRSRPRPGKTSSDISIRPHLKHKTTSSESSTSLSLNGSEPVIKKSSSMEEPWHEAQSRISQLSPGPSQKVSLADIIEHQQLGTGVAGTRGRTNRFWTYIGNNHMTQHPEMYSPEEIAKFAGKSSPPPGGRQSETFSFSTSTSAEQIRQSVKAASASTMSGRPSTPPTSYTTPVGERALSPAPVSPPRPGERNSDIRLSFEDDRVKSMVQPTETEFEEDAEETISSRYSGEEQIAHASPMVQVRTRDSIASLIDMY
ncbi:hypothetical protein K431DRAFT_224804 [Polychaeton citri CBS 116435]|uniref:PNPLA domain-containing protein n=1 Tax=Polychaeton citri CBS 116435 TaxID=1314669 RepID=A0A9P4UQQ5_9PEZI|nr:hypothetical protein K431DRAFT_224804 [Polychaeton citri CBS 116435]